MSSGDRSPLSIPVSDDLEDFAPRSPSSAPKIETKALDKVASFPSREASGTAQMNITGDKAVLDRFDRMCKADRRSRYAMLEILMDTLEKGQGD